MLQEDNTTVAVRLRLFCMEHLFQGFWFSKAADTILLFSVFIQGVFKNMPFSPEENPPGMASLIPLNSALLRSHLECCVLFLGSPAQERQWHMGANPGQWRQDVQRAGAPNVPGKAVRWVCSAWRRDAQGSVCRGFTDGFSCVMGG